MKIVICILLLFSSLLFSEEVGCIAYTRNSKDKLRKTAVSVNVLNKENGFESKFFSIRNKTEDKAIKFESSMSLRACTAFYHLEQARRFFSNNFSLNPFKEKKQIVIRLEMDQAFDDSVHFLPEKFGKVYNNAITIPPSAKMKLDEVNPWGYEIWFAPKKEIKLKSSFEESSGVLASKSVVGNLVFSVAEKELTIMMQDFARGQVWNQFTREYYFQSLLFSVGVTALVPNLMNWSSKLVKKKIFLDSGLIPEVIYHEYAHFALSDLINIGHSSPVGESVANYFASKISGRNNILKNSKPFMKGLVKIDGKKLKKYKYIYDNSKYAQADFGFKFLHALNRELGQNFDTLLIKSLEYLDKRKPLVIKNNLVPALQQSISDHSHGLNHFKYLNVLQEAGI